MLKGVVTESHLCISHQDYMSLVIKGDDGNNYHYQAFKIYSPISWIKYLQLFKVGDRVAFTGHMFNYDYANNYSVSDLHLGRG